MKATSGADVGSNFDVRRAVADRVAWTETIVITVLSIVLPAMAHPLNPFYVNEGFPWPALGPILCALRYGFSHGFTSSLILIVSIGTAINRQWWPVSEFPFTYSVGVIITAMLCGEFRDIWQRRLEKLQVANDYRAERLEEFTRAHHLLRISHDQLEQQLAGSGLSVREMFSQLQQQFARLHGFNRDNAQTALKVLAELGSLQVAAIYATPKGVLQNDLAKLGEMPAIDANDAILKRCLRERQTIAVTADINGIELAEQSRLLACVPFVDANNTVHAVMLVAAMPFFALTEARLRLLSIAAAHIADMLSHQADLDQRVQFDAVLQRMVRDGERFALESTLVFASAHNNVESQTALQHWQSAKRSLDVWKSEIVGDDVRLCILLPLTNDNGARQWLARLEKFESLSVSLECVSQTSAQRVVDWLTTAKAKQ